MSYVLSMMVFFVASSVGAGVTAGVFHVVTRNSGPGAIGYLMLWPIWLLIYVCTGAAVVVLLT